MLQYVKSDHYVEATIGFKSCCFEKTMKHFMAEEARLCQCGIKYFHTRWYHSSASRPIYKT